MTHDACAVVLLYLPNGQLVQESASAVLNCPDGHDNWVALVDSRGQ